MTVDGATALCRCGCGCEADGDWHWSQQPWCRCVPNACACVVDDEVARCICEKERWGRCICGTDEGPGQGCEAGDEALSSTLWSGGRSRAWSTHLATCAACRARDARARAVMEASRRG